MFGAEPAVPMPARPNLPGQSIGAGDYRLLRCRTSPRFHSRSAPAKVAGNCGYDAPGAGRPTEKLSLPGVQVANPQERYTIAVAEANLHSRPRRTGVADTSISYSQVSVSGEPRSLFRGIFHSR